MIDMLTADRSDDTLERLIFDGHVLESVLTELDQTVGSIEHHSEAPTKLQVRLTLGQLLGARRELDKLIEKVGQVVTAQRADPARSQADLVHCSSDR